MSIPAEHLQRFQPNDQGQMELPGVEAPPPTEATEAAALTEHDVELARATARADAFEEALKSRPEPAPQQVPQPPQPQPAWEEMTTKDIVQMVIKEVRQGDQQTRNQVGYEILKLKLEQQINQAQEAYPDFMEYSDEVVKISQEKGGAVTPVEAYQLAKARRQQTASRRPAAAGGQRPGTAKAAQPKPPANMREAASRAFEEVFGRRAR